MRSFPFSLGGEGAPVTLARVIRITRRDGYIHQFTSFQSNINVNGDVYIAEPAITISDIAFRNDGTPATLTLQTASNDQDIITFRDVAARRFGAADVQVSLVDASTPSAGAVSLLRGIVADIKYNRYGVITIEVRSRLALGRALLTEIYQPMDRAALGDKRNKIPILPDDVQRNTHYLVGDAVRARTASTNTPVDYANVVYAVLTEGDTASTEPAYNPTPGALITDGTAVLTPYNSWLRYAKVDVVLDSFDFTLTFLPDSAAVDNWFQLGQGIIRGGINDGIPFEIGQWIQSTLTVSTIDNISGLLFGGEWLELIPGYDRRLETLRDKFDDVINFRGERVWAGRDITNFAFHPGGIIGSSATFRDFRAFNPDDANINLPDDFSFLTISQNLGPSFPTDGSAPGDVIAVEFLPGSS